MPEWPQEIAKPRVLANFRRMRARNPKWVFRGNSESHVEMLLTFPCLIPGCTERDIEVHHMRSGFAEHHTYDCYAVPLCRWIHHADVHRRGPRHEPDWFASYGFEHDLCETAYRMFEAVDAGQALAIMVYAQRMALRTMAECFRAARKRSCVITLRPNEWKTIT